MHTRPTHEHTWAHTFSGETGPLVTGTSHAGQVSIPVGPVKGASSPAGLLKDLLEEAVAALLMGPRLKG